MNWGRSTVTRTLNLPSAQGNHYDLYTTKSTTHGFGFSTGYSRTQSRLPGLNQNTVSLLILNIFRVRHSRQPIVAVHSQVDVNVHNGANVIHEQERPHLTAAKGVSLEEVPICWKPSVPSKGHPSYVCVATKEWDSDNVTKAAISMRWVEYSRDPWRCEQRPKPSPCVHGGPNGASEALNHLPHRVWVSPRGRESTKQIKAKRSKIAP